jgi:2-polyprenyl-3-methyl-5-hydroxy-6-metoxy-1,4-benzoquinol methylase
MDENEWLQLNDEVRQIWDENAPFWDEYMGEGNPFSLQLVYPVVERLLQTIPGEQVLEIACGNGNFSRRLAAQGIHVLATDFSTIFLERARKRSIEMAGWIEYQEVDATDRQMLLAIGEKRFDAAVCNMALMDMADITPLLESLPILLKPGGRFVFAVTHPCFNSTGISRVAAETNREGSLDIIYAVKVSRYLTANAAKGVGVLGQPRPQYYFDRPLSLLLNTCFAAGFVLDCLEEPAFPLGAPSKRPFSWENFSEIPPVLAARLRLI